MMIDLHCHSTHSDGLLSPTALYARAQERGLHTLALTDHDTVAGVSELLQAAAGQDVRIIPGIELSVQWKKYDLHILGLNIDIHAEGLQDIIRQQQALRLERAQAIGEALHRCGIKDMYTKASELAGHTQIGRAHFAHILCKEGKARDMKDAFKTYLGRGKVAYIPASWINLSTAVATIQAANGQAVIAHPLKYGLTRTKLHELVQAFQALGGVGIEVVSGDIMDDDRDKLAKVCQKYALLASSGSDFHGDGLSRIGLGRQKSLPTHCTPIWHTWSMT